MSKKSESKSTTEVVTTTTTNIRDIGLTGQNVVDAVAVLEAGAVERERLGTRALEGLTSFADSLSARNASLSKSLPSELAEATSRVGGEDSDLVKLAPFFAAAAAIIVPFVIRR